MRTTRLTISLLALALTATACGSDDTAPSSSEPAPPSTTIPAPTSTSTVATTTTVAAAGPLTYRLVDTGQTACYDDTDSIVCPGPGEAFYGQDAQTGSDQPAYRDNGDGTVTDLVTELMWQRDPGTKQTYAEATAGADGFTLAGYDDWRLPTIKELYSLIDFSGTDASTCLGAGNCSAVPFLDTDAFSFSYGDIAAGERLIDAQWMSRTVYTGLTMQGDRSVFGVNFADGRIKGYPITDPQGSEKTFFIVHVRGNPTYGINDFVANGDGTVTDRATGLVWQQSDSGRGRNWSEALDYCETLGTGGYDDWHLPDVKQLQSILDYNRSPQTSRTAAIDPTFVTSTILDENDSDDWGFYWSSTTHASTTETASAAYVAFGTGYGWMQLPDSNDYRLLDVHGAGTQRSDPKAGNPFDYRLGRGPQGDVVRIYNMVRCVRGG